MKSICSGRHAPDSKSLCAAANARSEEHSSAPTTCLSRIPVLESIFSTDQSGNSAERSAVETVFSGRKYSIADIEACIEGPQVPIRRSGPGTHDSAPGRQPNRRFRPAVLRSWIDFSQVQQVVDG